MSRTKLVLVLLLVVVLGFVFGWFLQQWREGKVSASPVQQGAVTSAAKAVDKSGYCCIQTGSVCVGVANPGLCFSGGGRAFNSNERNCDYYCLNVKP